MNLRADLFVFHACIRWNVPSLSCASLNVHGYESNVIMNLTQKLVPNRGAADTPTLRFARGKIEHS